MLNGSIGFSNNYTFVAGFPLEGDVHLPSVLVHELGHLLGLNHNYNTQASVMRAGIYDGETRIWLHEDDSEGVTQLHWATQYGITVDVNDYIFFSPQTSSFGTNTNYLPGGDFYILNFVDEYPYGDYMETWDNWKCYASYGSGEILIMDSPSFNIPDLPGSYNWERDSYGNVIARMEIGGTDSDGHHHEASAEIKISGVPYPPSTPTGFSISGATGQHPTLSWNLNTESDIFKYNIYEDGGFLTSVNHPTNSFTYNGVTIGGRFDPQICFTVTAVSTSDLESDETSQECINASAVSKRYISEENSSIPTEYKLADSYPNPFNPATNIEFQLPQNANVVVKVYDIQGNEIEKLVNEYLSAGYYSVIFDGSNLSSGVYIYTIQMNDYHSVKKMMLVK